MPETRATVLAIRSSLIAFSNARSSCIFSVSNKALNLLRNLSTAAEREEHHNVIGYQAYDSLQKEQGSGGFNDDSQNLVHFQQHSQTSGLQNSYRSHQENPDGFYTENSMQVQNSSFAPRQASRNDYLNSSVVHENSIRSNEQNYGGDLWMRKAEMNQPNVGTYQQNPNTGLYGHVTNPNYPDPMYRPNYQTNPIAGQCQQSSVSVQFGQNPYHGQYLQSADEQNLPNLNTTRNSMVNTQVSNNMNADGETAELTAEHQYKGTIEELDECCQEGKLKEAVEVLELLEKQNIQVDLARYLQLMHACGEAKSLEEARAVYNYVVKCQSPLKVGTFNKILEMYSKCGSMNDAYMIFSKMPHRNLTSWDTMITWLAKNGLGEDAIDLFYEFKRAGMKPDGKMFIGVFYACSVLGDVDEGMLHFESMTKNFGIIPSMDHYVSVVDMLGSVGYLEEALEFIEKMPLEPGVKIWETMMNISRAHGLVELGDRCFELVEQLDPSCLNEQSKAGLVPVKASDLAKEREKKKLAKQNLLEVRSRVHEYRAGDTSHPENDKIYALLRGLREQMKEAGYIPETRFVLHDIDQEGKNDALLSHSERLAVAYGLISSSARSPIRVIKNLRVCGDCHNALKIISNLVGRELIMRDAKRFHHFKDGLCSCRDYW